MSLVKNFKARFDKRVSQVSLGEDLLGLNRLLEGWFTGNAVSLNTEVVCVHVHVEETIVSPVGAPRVATDPVFLAFLGHTVSHDRDLVIEEQEFDIILVNAAIVVVIEVVGSVDTAGDGAVLELGLHHLSTLHVVIFADVVAVHVSDGGASLDATFSNRGRGSSAVTAHIDGLAAAIDIVVSLVVSAATMDEAGCVGELVHITGVSTIAGATSVAVDNHLGGKSKRAGHHVILQDVESISDSRCSSLGPA